MKMRWLIPLSGLLVWMLNSCSTGVGGAAGGSFISPYAPKMEGAPSASLRSDDGAINRNSIDAVLNNPNRTGGGSIKSSEAFAAPRKERPGLATTFGRSIKSPMPNTGFEHAHRSLRASMPSTTTIVKG